jgi:protoporphyrinogen oxidase
MRESNGMNTPEEIDERKTVVIIGGGPAGLTAAYELTKHNVQPIVLEKLDKVGGISRTENRDGYHFDMGGHRFFTKSQEVARFWHEALGDDLLRRPRLSRIFYRGKFFHYPLKALNALMGLGVREGVLLVLSYLRWQIFPNREEDTFEQWVVNRFGRRLFLTFFKTYTEKVWGIACSELRAEWAAQRIKDLSMKTALLSMFLQNGRKVKTLIEEFEYPRCGPGMLWSSVKDQVELRGGQVHLNSEVIEIHRDERRIESVTVTCNGRTQTIRGTDFVSSMPITEFVQRLDPPPPAGVLRAAAQLKHRGFLTVCLIVNRAELFPDTWIYVHDPTVKVGRIQNFKNWSPEMVPEPSKTSLGLEYFCNEGDELWNMTDAELVELGKQEIAQIGLAKYDDIQEGYVFRVPKAYPIYDPDYREHLATVREYVATLVNFQTIGRNGLHRYNNQDHAMLTAMLAVRNVVLREHNDLWAVNDDQEYLEESLDEAQADLLEATELIRDTLTQVFARLEPTAFGLSVGSVAGALLFLATLFLVLKGGDVVGPHLRLLGEYLPGYTVTLSGSLLGLAYGFAVGFVAGWTYSFLRNVAMFLYMAIVQRRAELSILRRIFDYI